MRTEPPTLTATVPASEWWQQVDRVKSQNGLDADQHRRLWVRVDLADRLGCGPCLGRVDLHAAASPFRRAPRAVVVGPADQPLGRALAAG